MRISKIFIYSVFLFAVSSLAAATTPQLINYQGRLLDSTGQAIPDGNYTISFAIYDSPTDGQMKWAETQTDVPVVEGLFSVVMGSLMPLTDTVFSGEDRYLEISVQGQIMSPRTQFTSVGYAHRISTVDGATAGELSGSLTISPEEFATSGNALTVVDANDAPVFGVSVDALGLSTVSLYEPTAVKDGSEKNAAEKVLDMSVNSDGLGTISFYDPVDSKAGSGLAAATVMQLSVDPQGAGTISFYDPVDSKSGFNAAATKALEISVDQQGLGTISFYEPTDSKFGFADSSSRKVEMNKNGLVMFGQTGFDTSLVVLPNGDIRGLGQITMGENSSSGVQTSVLGFDNNASGDSSSIGGGSFNEASGTISVIGGGHANIAFGIGTTIGGGSFNQAFGLYSTIGGGNNNMTLGDYAVVPGGQYNFGNGNYSLAAGYRAKAEHGGTFVWADMTEADFISTDANQFIIRASGGVGIGTNNPVGLLDVSGFTGDSSVNFPEDAVSAGEIFDEPGISSDREANEITLVQSAASMVDIVTTTITIPTSGYIVVHAGATMESSGSTGANHTLFQIDETPGGGAITPYYSTAGTGDHDSPNSLHYFSMRSERVYYREAGTYQFRFEAQPGPLNDDGAVTKIQNAHITAMYFPTAYGTVYTSSGN